MSSTDPDEIRAQIDRTRMDLSADVNALGEAVAPGTIARRQVQKVRGGAADLKDRVMGRPAPSPSDARDLVSGVHDAALDKATGNPLAAGVVALGVGWLLGSLLPSSHTERELAGRAKEAAAPVLDEARSLAQDAAEHLKEPAGEAAQSIAQSAREAVDAVRSEGRAQAEQVGRSAQESRAAVQEHLDRPDTSA